MGGPRLEIRNDGIRAQGITTPEAIGTPLFKAGRCAMAHGARKPIVAPDRMRPAPGPNGGVADTLDEAKAAFRAASERRPQRCPAASRFVASVRFRQKKQTRNAQPKPICS
jgi:hypothetical protein